MLGVWGCWFVCYASLTKYIEELIIAELPTTIVISKTPNSKTLALYPGLVAGEFGDNFCSSLGFQEIHLRKASTVIDIEKVIDSAPSTRGERATKIGMN